MECISERANFDATEKLQKSKDENKAHYWFTKKQMSTFTEKHPQQMNTLQRKLMGYCKTTMTMAQRTTNLNYGALAKLFSLTTCTEAVKLKC